MNKHTYVLASAAAVCVLGVLCWNEFKALMVWFISDKQKLLHICPHSDCSKSMWVRKLEHDCHWRYLIHMHTHTHTHTHSQLSASWESQRCLSVSVQCLHSSLSEHREYTMKKDSLLEKIHLKTQNSLYCSLNIHPFIHFSHVGCMDKLPWSLQDLCKSKQLVCCSRTKTEASSLLLNLRFTEPQKLQSFCLPDACLLLQESSGPNNLTWCLL